MSGSRFLLPLLLAGAVLSLTLAPVSLAWAPQTAASKPWYISKWPGHDHGAHAGHTAPAPHVWELYREIDPREVGERQLMFEVTQFPREEPPTVEQRRQAEEFVRGCRDAVLRHGWDSFEKAKADGFELMYSDAFHYVHEKYVMDDTQVDCDRPEFLLFFDTSAGKRLAAFMFLARSSADHGRQIAGPLTLWHFHVWAKPRCLRGPLVVGDPDSDGRCADGVPRSRSPEMMHVWLIDHPGGPFAADMALTDDMRKNLEQPLSR